MDVFWIPELGPVRLGTALGPAGGDELAEEVKSWRDEGVQVVVSVLTPLEVESLELEREWQLCQELGITYRSLPIEDHSIPEDEAAVTAVVDQINDHLNRGQPVIVHCRMGIGRSTLVAACALVKHGISADRALELISRARGWPVPDTAAQEEWVRSFARSVGTKEGAQPR